MPYSKENPQKTVEMSELTKDEMEKVITVHLTRASSVSMWLLRKDFAFCYRVASILTSTEFPVSGPDNNNEMNV